jgi:hypothetical protein
MDSIVSERIFIHSHHFWEPVALVLDYRFELVRLHGSEPQRDNRIKLLCLSTELKLSVTKKLEMASEHEDQFRGLLN